jgi:hypothetical protein
LNIAHLHFRFARQASERDGQLGATITPHAATAGAIDLDIPRHREPDPSRRGDAAKGATAHVLFIRGLKGLSRTGCSKQQLTAK